MPIFAGMPIKPTAKIKRKPFGSKPAYSEGPYNCTAWRKLRIQVLQSDPICTACGRKPSTVADHINPVRLGGNFWDINNIQGLCASCHNSKSAKESKL